jgi:predicted MFS family arabinose efflux permease
VLVFAIVKATDYGWGSWKTLALGAIAVALLAAFVYIEKHSPAPLIRLGIFRSRSIVGANLVMLVVAGGLFSFFFFATLYLQGILGYSPLEAGLAFLPVTAGIMIGAGLAQQLVKRIGVRAVSVLGMAIAATGLFILSSASVGGSYLSDILPGLIPQSIGMGLTFVPITLIATTNVEAEDAGLASGLFNTSQQVGGSLGLAILSTLAANKTASMLLGGSGRAQALVDGFNVAFVAAAVLVAAGALVLLLVVRKSDVANVNPEAAPVPGV